MKRFIIVAFCILNLITLSCAKPQAVSQTEPRLSDAIQTQSPTVTDEVMIIKLVTPEPTANITPEPTATAIPVYEIGNISVRADAKELDLHGRAVDVVQVEELILKLPELERINLCDCGIEEEKLAVLCDTYTDIKFVFDISLGFWGKLRTDATTFTTRSSKSKDEMKYRLHTEDIQMLRYCTDLVALDLGHQQIEDISALSTLTKLQVLILADNKISDLTPLESMHDLVYLELFMNRIVDVSPLTKLENLIDLNICTNRIEDITPFSRLQKLERLWYSNNKYTKNDHNELQSLMPNCHCNRTVWDETADGWREHERYFWMREFFKDSPRFK